MTLPREVEEIIETLEKSGYEAYAVGGCVRDFLCGREISDWDVTTNATPDAVAAVFKGRNVVPTGVKHGTVSLMLRGAAYEITTYRVDGRYLDGRRPESVSFTGDLREDLSRRDFTINAMAYNPRTGLLDLFGGADDIKRRVVRCVGTPAERFGEDYLRMMRAYRFAAVLDFDLDPSIRDAVALRKNKILDIAAERLRAELDKLMLSRAHDRFLLFMSDLGGALFPEVECLKEITQANAYHDQSAYDHSMEVFRHAKPDLTHKLCALLHDTGKADTKTVNAAGETSFKGHAELSEKIALAVLRRLKYDNARISAVTAIIRAHSAYKQLTRPGAKRVLMRMGPNLARELYHFAIADCHGKTPAAKHLLLPALTANLSLFDDIQTSGEPVTLRDLAINGDDVAKALSTPPGKAVGDALSILLDQVHKDPTLNKREILLEILRSKE